MNLITKIKLKNLINVKQYAAENYTDLDRLSQDEYKRVFPMIEDINKEPNLLLLYNSIFKINKIKEDYEGILSIKAELQHNSLEDINQYKNDIDTLNSRLDNVVDSIEKSLISALKSSHGLICDIEGIHNLAKDGKSTANFLVLERTKQKDLIKLSKISPDKMTDEKFIKKQNYDAKS